MTDMAASIPRTFHLAVAFTSRTQGIGKAGKLPWRLPGDLAYFKEVTSKTTAANTAADSESNAAAVLALARNVASSLSSSPAVSSTLPPSAVVNATIMGRKTWESIPAKFRPLPGRLNVVLSRSSANDVIAAAANDENATPIASAASALTSPKPLFEGAVAAPSLDAALALLSSPALSRHVERVLVIGGGAVYAEALTHKGCTAAHVTRVFEDDVDDSSMATSTSTPTSETKSDNKFGCDVFFPQMDPTEWRLWAAAPPRSDAGVRYRFETWVRAKNEKDKDGAGDGGGDGRNGDGGAPSSSPPSPASFPEGGPSDGMPRGAAYTIQHAEEQYLNLIREILDQGVARGDRTGTGTLSVFGRSMRFDLRNGLFPLLTTKRVFWRGVVEELLWFVRGSTDASELSSKGIRIWDGNGSRAFLDAAGLRHRTVGDLGPVYGFQWRHFGAAYSTAAADYTNEGVDQLADVIDQIKNNPQSRRIVLTAWNPAALSEMALPPCHMFAQFYVARGELSCQMYQRSADMGKRFFSEFFPLCFFSVFFPPREASRGGQRKKKPSEIKTKTLFLFSPPPPPFPLPLSFSLSLSLSNIIKKL